MLEYPTSPLISRILCIILCVFSSQNIPSESVLLILLQNPHVPLHAVHDLIAQMQLFLQMRQNHPFDRLFYPSPFIHPSSPTIHRIRDLLHFLRDVLAVYQHIPVLRQLLRNHLHRAFLLRSQREEPMELAVDRAVQRQRQAAQIVDERRWNVVNRRFLDVRRAEERYFEHELHDDALGCSAERHRIAESAAQKNHSRLEEMIDVVVGGAVELAQLHARLALDEHVPGDEVVEDWVILGVLECVEIRSGRNAVASAGQLTTAHRVDVFGSRKKRFRENTPCRALREEDAACPCLIGRSSRICRISILGG